MNYSEALAYIHSLGRLGSRPGLDRVRKLFAREPRILEQKFIHVTGTNGKGSASSMLACILRAAGYKTGLYTSPYVVDFRERIQINGEMIPEEQLAAAVEHFKPIMDELHSEGVVITEFELVTAIGFWLFRENACDVIVCEVGMGGRADATNLIPSPLCSVLTRIALDHTAALGGSIPEIAAHKCGIIKPGCAAATSAQDDEAMRVILDTVEAMGCPLYRGDSIVLHNVGGSLSGTGFTYMGEEMRLTLIGEHQVENLRCVLAAVEALNDIHGMGVTAEHIRKGIAEVKHPARFERLNDEPIVILDGAHNPNGLKAFADAVRGYAPEGGRTLVIGMLADKDSGGLEHLRGLFTRAIATNIDNPRALDAGTLAEKLRDIFDEVEVVPEPPEAFRKAMRYGDGVYICGSLYLASEIRPYIIEYLK